MKHKNFIYKLLTLIAIALCLCCYQIITVQRTEIIEENKTAVAEAKAYNAKIEAQMKEASGGAANTYQDGTYEGEGEGFGGKITAEVTLVNDQITEIEITDHSGEDPAYYSEAEKLIDDIIAYQTTDVDTVSGATFSSNGILDAVTDAIIKAGESNAE